jgi:hypothetical protein
MPTHASPNLDDMLRVLHAATDNNRLKWTTTAEENTFRAAFDLGMVRVAREPFTTHGYSLSLIDKEGTLLDEYLPSGEGQRIAIETLYKKVRNNALSLDKKVMGLYDRLKDLAGES